MFQIRSLAAALSLRRQVPLSSCRSGNLPSGTAATSSPSMSAVLEKRGRNLDKANDKNCGPVRFVANSAGILG
ncbi:hypothetical protein F4604DRAFT_1742513 [Suillus subluteus]|nr:hypothetical protein F4604DRAFT_1742513 [Suillus subluteus]